MLETLDLSRSLSKEEFRALVRPLGIRLGELQRELRARKIATCVVFEGWGAAGKGRCIGALMQPLDPRGFKVHTSRPASHDEALRPFLWRYWTRLPARGEIAIFDESWYGRVLGGRRREAEPAREHRDPYGAINDFEALLQGGGMVLVKLWLHVSRKEQRRRLEKLARDRSESWKVDDADWRENREYKARVGRVEEMLERTSTAIAPWTLVPAEDRRAAIAKVFESLAAAWSDALSRPAAEPPARGARARPRRRASGSLLARVDLGKRMRPERYSALLKPLQKQARALEHDLYRHRVPVVVVFEGWDAAGKGGAIRRLTEEMDPRGFEVIPVSAPNEVEREYHYLWRFWRHIPKAGHIALFDRSWYGRVLVERVEGFCTEAEWRRAYREINELERDLANEGAVVLKLWLHIGKDVQLERFREREATGYKKWKITGEDWRNRAKWPLYEQAADEMIERTSTSYAPWVVIPANDKYHARIAVLRTFIRAVEARLKTRRAVGSPTPPRRGK